MSTKKWIIIIVAAFILVLVGIIGIFILSGGDKNKGQERGGLFGGFSNVLPFGDGVGTTAEDGSDNFEAGGQVPRLRRISEQPVSGATFISTNGMLFARYLERETGHIFDIALTSNERPKRISNTTIPRISRAEFFGENNVVLQFIDEQNVLQTFIGAVESESSTSSPSENTGVTGFFLSENSISYTINPNSKSLFYLTPKAQGSQGILLNLENQKERVVFNSSFSEWNVAWKDENKILFTTKSAAGVPGYLYTLNLNSTAFSKVLGGISSLSTKTNKDGSKILLYEERPDSNNLSIYTLSSEENVLVPFSTLAEKCAWNRDSSVLYCATPNPPIVPSANIDQWYRGEVSFSDEIWKFDIKNGKAEFLLSTAEARALSLPLGSFAPDSVFGLDIVNLHVDNDETHIIFTNKKDNTLWALRIKE